MRLKVENENRDIPIAELEKTLRAAFQMRRKTILNSLSSGLSIEKEVIKDVLGELNLSENLRAENLNLKDYLELTKRLVNSTEGV